MVLPGNGIYVVQGEMSMLLMAMRRGGRWSSQSYHSYQDDENDTLICLFMKLKEVLSRLGDLRHLDPSHYLEPFLEVIRSEETTGPVTSLALESVSKFLSFNLIDPSSKCAPACVETIADAVTRARFVGTDQASDGVVLMKILQVLRTLMLSPVGPLLSNESACEIMLSCFRICFEMRLSELLRRSAEHCLKDLVQLVFTRLPEFSDDQRISSNLKKLKMRTGATEPNGVRTSKRKARTSLRNKQERASTRKVVRESSVPPIMNSVDNGPLAAPLTLSCAADQGSVLDMQGAIHQTTGHRGAEVDDDVGGGTSPVQQQQIEDEQPVAASKDDHTNENRASASSEVEATEEDVGRVAVDETSGDETNQPETNSETTPSVASGRQTGGDCPASVADGANSAPCVINSVAQETEYVNRQGVRFTSADEDEDEDAPQVPYGLECVRELFRFLVSLCNPNEKQNTEKMLHMGLTLLTVALEVGADSIGQYQALLALVQDDLCRNLFSLMSSERITLLASALRVAFLLFESLRTHLKFQLERYVLHLADIVASDSPKITYEHKELALESIVQLWRIPGLVTELYLNYDCDLYCSNVFEDLAKLLSKNTFPVSGLYSTHLLSLDALITVIESIERNCHSRMQSEPQESTVVDDSNFNDSQSPAGVPTSAPIFIRTGRSNISQNIPTHEQLMAVKHKKKLLSTGTEQFNSKPKKGIQYLQEHHLLSTPLDPNEVVHFLRDNPRLDKKMIGEYISNRENLVVLDCFVKSFDFTDMRIDDALRQYLEMFRLPGESPLISLVLEHFADHWHKSNGSPFANNDAAFTLAYAVIMLNVDQHNHHAKRQNNPMTADDFKRNLKKVNGGKDFEEEMLDKIYSSIRSCEIVMPAEQTGLVRENYLWKVLLRRGGGRDGIFMHAPNGLFDHDLFSLIWGPAVAALSFIFDRSTDPAVYQKAIAGFLKCALISAHYGMSNDFDNLIISLCKFTTLATSTESAGSLPVSFGSNAKAQLVTRTVFGLAQRHGDILRHGWANVLDCLLQLYRCKLLPKVLTEAEDFIEPNGKISLMREETPSQKTETGLLSSLYSYIALSSETGAQRMISQEDQECIQQARSCVRECHLEQIITESKFLRLDSLQELVKALILASHGADGHPSLGTPHNEDAATFFLEILLKVVIQNRDRVSSVWASVRDHIYSLLMGAVACEHHFLMERCIVGLLRLAIRLMRREEMSPIVLQSLRMLLLLKRAALARVSRNVAYGLHELLKTSAANIHTDADWSVIFTLLEVVGAGAPPPRVVTPHSSSDQGAKSDGELHQGSVGSQEDSGIGTERGYTSDSELSRSSAGLSTTSLASSQPSPTSQTSPELSPSNATNGGWIMVGREGEIQPLPLRAIRSSLGPLMGPMGPSRDRELLAHDPHALIKCCESLTFLVRDVAHITPYNFEYCVHCIRTFVEASLQSTDKRNARKSGTQSKETTVKSRKKLPSLRRREDQNHNTAAHRRARSPQNNPYDADESDSEELPSEYPIQLLDLMHTLHTRTAQIYRWWAEESGDMEQPSLWSVGWRPLLQGISRLCCDSRKEVRMSAITYLQSALLMHDLQTLSAQEWESCFSQVLFPLLARLLEPVCPGDPACRAREEETRMRGATLLSKVFLHHLTPMLSLPNFTALWLTILDFMDKYMHADRSDLLLEAVPETLKNMLLVMDSAKVFSSADGYTPLWTVTWERIDSFLPSLRGEFFKAHPSETQPKSVKSDENFRSPDCEVLPNQVGALLLQQQQTEDNQQLIEKEDQKCQESSPKLVWQEQQPQPVLGFTPIQAAPAAAAPLVDPAPISVPLPLSSLPMTIPDPSQQGAASPCSSNIILQPPAPLPAMPASASTTTIFPHMGKLVSTPITGPSVLTPSISSYSSGMTPDAVLEAFTPTRNSTAPRSYTGAYPEGGMIPTSCYFYQEQPQQLQQLQLQSGSGTVMTMTTQNLCDLPAGPGGPGPGSRGILLEGASIPTLPILSPFAAAPAAREPKSGED